jgi:hypothetical protein
MSAWRAALCACLLPVLAGASTADAQTLTGVVLDPQDRRVAGARVSLTCAGEVRQATTDGEGRFIVSRQPGGLPCVLGVNAPAFAPMSEAVDTARRSPLVVRLAVAPIAETVDVRADDVAGRTAAGVILLRGEDLRTISNDPNEIVRYAKARAGSGTAHAVYVDGLPSEQLPPVSRIAMLSVNADPYSTEYSDAGSRRIEITTSQPDRHWRVTFGGAPPTIGARNPLAAANHSTVRSLGGSLAGPVPRASGSFSVNATMETSDTEPVIVAVVPNAASGAGPIVQGATNRRVVSLQLHQKLSARTNLRIDAAQTTDSTTHAGVGGEVLAEAGGSRRGTDTEVRMTVTHTSPGVVWRNQVLGDSRNQATTASSGGAGVWVPGAFIGGGSPTLSSQTGQSLLFWKSVVTSTAADEWRAGITVQHGAGRVSQVPNAAGYMQLASPDAWSRAVKGFPLGNYYRFTIPTTQHVALSEVAAFAEGVMARLPHAVLRGGVRVDWQSRDHAFLSPRLSATSHLRAWTFSGGIGMFTRSWRPELLLGTRAAEGETPTQLISRQVSFADIAAGAVTGEPIETDVAAGLTRARYIMASEAAECRFGPVTAGVEHVWWHGRHLLGARRVRAAGAGWTDWLESNRRSDSHELRARVEAGGPRRSIAVTYGWTRARDDTDGPFSFPARQNDLQAEWARSARAAAHNVDVAASATFPGGVRATAIATLRGASPYDIVSGLDGEGNGLQTDRAGLARNSGNGPTYRTVSVFLHRRFNLSAILGPRLNLPIDAGAQFDNALGTRNWTAFGNVLGSPLFGRPEGALPGRSLRVWFAVAR